MGPRILCTAASLFLAGGLTLATSPSLANPTDECTPADELQSNVETLTASIGQDPDNPRLYINRGRAHSLTHAYDAAFADYDRAIALSPKLAVAWQGRAFVHMKRNQPDRALEDINRAHEFNPRDGVTRLGRGLVLESLGRQNEADQDFYEMKFDERLYDSISTAANLCQSQGRNEEAVELAELVIRFSPRRARDFHCRALAYLELREPQKALLDLDEALRLESNPREKFVLYQNRSRAWYALGRYAEAIADCDAAAAIDPKFHGALRSRAYIHWGFGNYELALADLQKCQVYYELLRVPDPGGYPLVIKRSAAAQWYHVPRDRGRGALQRQADLLMPQSTDAESPIKVAPDERTANLAMIHSLIATLLASCRNDNLRSGQQALVHAQTACQLTHFSDARSLKALAAAHAELGQFADAVGWQNKAIELDPNDEYAREQLIDYKQSKPLRFDASKKKRR